MNEVKKELPTDLNELSKAMEQMAEELNEKKVLQEQKKEV